jgi:hypothetical protein
MRLPDFTAEASLYRGSETYHAMGAAGLARGPEVLPAQTSQVEAAFEICIGCGDRRCCCFAPRRPYCTGLAGDQCGCTLPR